MNRDYGTTSLRNIRFLKPKIEVVVVRLIYWSEGKIIYGKRDSNKITKTFKNIYSHEFELSIVLCMFWQGQIFFSNMNLIVGLKIEFGPDSPSIYSIIF